MSQGDAESSSSPDGRPSKSPTHHRSSKKVGNWFKKFGVSWGIGSLVVVIVVGQFRHSMRFDPTLPSSLEASNAKSLSLQSSIISRTGREFFPDWNRANPLAIPRGQAQNLPSIRVEQNNNEHNVDKVRQYYGGKGDKAHLGGFTELDLHGVAPGTWRHMVEDLNIHSILDVGCGRGISTSWFVDHGLDVMCVEGSHDAILQSVLDEPSKTVVEHDFSRGPWWPAKTFDAVWCVEFLEHVGLNYHFNYITTFRKAAVIFATSSRWGGWHHVEVHDDDWWILKFEAYGFQYSEKMTEQIRKWAKDEGGIAPNGERYNPQHVWLSMKVFINPIVAALPEHAHLFFEHGCYGGKNQTHRNHRKCGEGQDVDPLTESKMPPQYMPLTLTPDMDDKWIQRIKRNIKVKAPEK